MTGVQTCALPIYYRLAGATYDIQAVKEVDGLGKIKTLIVKVIWNLGTPAVIQHA